MKTFIGCLAVCLIALAAEREAWLSSVPAEHRDALAKRLDGYVKANHSQNWAKLFEFISDAARGGVDRSDFVPKMKAAHRRDFSNSPDLLEFQPVRTIKADNSEYDVYGCAKAQREGREYNGVALVHAVFQHNDWFFSGWRFHGVPERAVQGAVRSEVGSTKSYGVEPADGGTEEPRRTPVPRRFAEEVNAGPFAQVR